MSIGGYTSQSWWQAGQTFPKASMALRPPKKPFVGILRGGRGRKDWSSKERRVVDTWLVASKSVTRAAIVTQSYPRPASLCPANYALLHGSHLPAIHSTPHSSDIHPSQLARLDSNSLRQGLRSTPAHSRQIPAAAHIPRLGSSTPPSLSSPRSYEKVVPDVRITR